MKTLLIPRNSVIKDVIFISKKPFFKWPTVFPFILVYILLTIVYFFPHLVWGEAEYIVYQQEIDLFHSVLNVFVVFLHVLISLFTVWSVKFRVFCLFNMLNCKEIKKATHVYVIVHVHKGTNEITPLIHLKKNFQNRYEIYFIFQQRKWTYNFDENIFSKPLFFNKQPKSFYYTCQGISSETELSEKLRNYGKNLLPLDVPDFSELFIDHVFAPFFVFQMFSLLLWCLDEYWMYPIFTGFLLVVMESTVVMQRIRNMKTLRQMGEVPIISVIVKRSGKFVKISSSELVPMDLLVVSSNAPCPVDCVLVNGTCVMNESMLTGESTPQLKEAIEKADEIFIPKRDTRNMLFSGTQVLLSSGSTDVFSYDIKSAATAIVLKTGFETKQGKLLRTILHSQGRISENSGEAFAFIGILLVFALMASGFLLYRGLSDPTKSKWKLILHCTQIITAVVPTQLPMELSLAVNTSLIALVQKKVFCTEPFRIPLAGKLDTCCFDKTGTLTTDEMLFNGIDLSDDKGLRHVIKDIPINSELILSGCQSIVRLDGSNAGDAMEIAAFEALGYNMIKDDVAEKENTKIKIVTRFPFNPVLRRMSSIITTGEKKLIVTKGGPESIKSICQFVPDDFDNVFENYALSGYRVIALAYKIVPSEFCSKALISTIPRETAERDLIFSGFAIFSSPLKKDAKETIQCLIEGSHRCVIITGDSIQTALAISRQIGITSTEKQLIAKLHKDDPRSKDIIDGFHANPSVFPAIIYDCINKKYNCLGVSTKELISNTYTLLPTHLYSEKITKKQKESKHDLCVDADGMPSEIFDKIIQESSHVVSVWARCTPSQKEDIISRLKILGHVVLMAGDGTNDVGALKQAQVGVAVLNSKAVSAQTIENSDEPIDPSLPPIPPGFNLTPVPPPLNKSASFFDRIRYEATLKKRQLQIAQLEALEKKRKTKKDQATVEESKTDSLKSIMESAFNKDFEDDMMNPIIKLGDASIAAPFTSKSKRLMSIVDIVRNGRSTLVTTFQMYKILALNCLIGAYSMSVLHNYGIKMGDKQMMITGLILSICFLCLTRCQPIEKLSSQRPITSIFHPYMVCSIFGQFAIHLFSFIYSVKLVTDIDIDAINTQRADVDKPDFRPTLLNSIIFLMETTMTATTFIANYRGEPFMQKMSKNKPLIISLVILFLLIFLFSLEIDPELNEYFEIVKMPSDDFRTKFVRLLLVDMLGSYIIEIICLKVLTDG